MKLTQKVRRILDNYPSESPAVRARLAGLLMAGRLGGTGRLVILPVDQGFEHGPARSFAGNPAAYDPLYHWRIAIKARLSAFAAPLGLLEAGAGLHAGEIPTILKLNSSNSIGEAKDQAVTASPQDALRLGAGAVGLTIYPGAEASLEQYEEARAIVAEARSLGLASVIWSYPRGGALSKEGETALDSIAYGAHIAALLGAHIIKVKPPSEVLENGEARAAYEKAGVARGSLAERVAHVGQACFDGRRMVVFSGGAATSEAALLEQVRAVRDGGGHGSIVGRNVFQRPEGEALALLEKILAVYQGK